MYLTVLQERYCNLVSDLHLPHYTHTRPGKRSVDQRLIVTTSMLKVAKQSILKSAKFTISPSSSSSS